MHLSCTHPAFKQFCASVAGIICLMLPISHGHSQVTVKAESISTERGLSQGAILDILQDREGFLWVGTKDGLNRYDGYGFTVFTYDPNDPWSICGNTITHLFEDSSGRVWAASDNGGINIYNKATGRFHRLQYDPEDTATPNGSYINFITEDTSGCFVVGVDGVEINLFFLDQSFFENQEVPHIRRVPLPLRKGPGGGLHAILNGLVQDAKGRIWVGGEDAIYHLDVQHASLTLAAEGYSLGAAFVNPDGSVWSCGPHHTDVIHWDGTQASPFRTTSVQEQLRSAMDFYIDDQEQMWCLTAEALYVFDLKGWEPGMVLNTGSGQVLEWNLEASADKYPFKSMARDRSGVLWIGTNGLGLYKINPDHSKVLHLLPGISVRKIIPVSDKNIYIKDYGFGWFKTDGTRLQMDPLGVDGDKFIHDNMVVSESGEYWIRRPTLLENGKVNIKKYDPNTGATKLYPVSMHHYDDQPMIECSDGSILMAGFNDILTRIDPSTEEVTAYNLKDGKVIEFAEDSVQLFSQDYSTALYEDGEGTLWVGTERGIVKIARPKRWGAQLELTRYENIYGDNTSLSYNHVMCFLDDPMLPGRYLWVCTKGGGLNRLDKTSGSFLRLTKKDGLPDNVIYGVLADRDGNLWGSTNNGIFSMSRVADGLDNRNFVFRNFSRVDGFQGSEFNTGAYATLPGGKLAFGGINGVNIFDPRDLLGNDFEPRVFITGISINNDPVTPGDITDVLEQTIETTKEITLTHGQDILTLEFASLDFRAAELNKYRYQLVGADDSWVEAGNRRSATFLDLRPGNYTFRVQGTNSRGVWSKQIAQLQIHILPPWWSSWWAYTIYIVLIFTVIWTFLQFSINRSRLRQRVEFEHREAERVKELDAMKTQLFMNMTHEFRTPLSIILGMAQQVRSDPKQNFRNGMDMIIRNGQNLLNLVNKMLSLSKLESGKLTLDLVQGDIIMFLRNIVESFRSFASHKEIQLHFLPEVDEVIMDYDPDKLQQVISNLISNAFKFTPEGGHIYFAVRREDEALVIRVKDTGLGIPAKDQGKIFDRFYQVDNTMTREYEGTGIGLALTSQLINLMKGEIKVESPPAGSKQGSEFIVGLPMYKEALIAIEQIGKPQEDTKININGSTTSVIQMYEPPDATIRDFNVDKNQPLILLVEDNSDVVGYVASCLPDYQLAVAGNGKEGLEMAIDIVPDLIISDVMMPVMDGFQLCRKLKSDNRTDHIPVVMLTARADLESKIEGLEFGANAYLAKPFEKQELILTLKNLFSLRSNLRRHHRAIIGLSDNGNGNHDLPGEGAEDPFVIKVRDIVSAHISDFNFNVETLAAELFLSRSQLGRKIDALTGLSPKRFIRAMRLKKAKELLLHKDASITSVAYDCGFNDPGYFARVFKKEFGLSPVEWRASQQVKS